MIKRIEKWILKGRQTDSPQGRKAYGVFAGLLGTFVNILLGAGKWIAGNAIGSVSLIADGANNLTDSISALITLFTVRAGQKPKDKDHPFGHGRVEYIGSFIIGFFIMLMAWEMLKGSIEQIAAPKAVTFSWVSVGVIGVSIVIKIGLYLFYTKLGKKIQSLPLIATGKDALSDVAASSAVLTGLLLNRFLGWNIDGYIGLVVVAFIGKNAWDVLKETGDRLIGGKQDLWLREQVTEILLHQPGILGIHDLHLHDYGPGRSYATVDAEVDARDSVVNIHRFIDQAERKIEKELNLSISIHIDPVEEVGGELEKIRDEIVFYLQQVHPKLSIHDFQHAHIGKYTDIYFDVVVPEDYQGKREALEEDLKSRICGQSSLYRCIIDFDIEMAGE